MHYSWTAKYADTFSARNSHYTRAIRFYIFLSSFFQSLTFSLEKETLLKGMECLFARGASPRDSSYITLPR